jgi:hypothetical protein
MGLFPRRPSKPDDLDPEMSTGVEVIRRIKVTTDRYWVSSERPVDASPEKQTLTQQEKEDEGNAAP